MGMSLADFCLLTPEEFRAVWQAWADMKEQQERSAWERMRMQAAMTAANTMAGKGS